MHARIRPALLAAAVALAPAALHAQTPAPPATIDACYVPASGTIYRINTTASPAPGAPSACLSATHVRFTWNQQGPKGDAGVAGARGPQGAQGVQGVQGLKGDKGDTGPAATLGYQRVTRVLSLAPSNYLGISAVCPVGKKVVGGGVDFSNVTSLNQIRNVAIRESYPVSDSEWRFGIDNANTFEMTATLYAVCL